MDDIVIEEYPNSQSPSPPSVHHTAGIHKDDVDIEEYPSSQVDHQNLPTTQPEDIEIEEYPNSPLNEGLLFSDEDENAEIEEFPDIKSPPKNIPKSSHRKTERRNLVVELPSGINRSSETGKYDQRARRHRFKKEGLADQLRKSQKNRTTEVLLWRQKVKQDPIAHSRHPENLKLEIIEAGRDRSLVKVLCGGGNASGRAPAELSQPCFVVLDKTWAEPENMKLLAPGKHLLIHPPYHHIEKSQLFPHPVYLCPRYVAIQSSMPSLV